MNVLAGATRLRSDLYEMVIKNESIEPNHPRCESESLRAPDDRNGWFIASFEPVSMPGHTTLPRVVILWARHRDSDPVKEGIARGRDLIEQRIVQELNSCYGPVRNEETVERLTRVLHMVQDDANFENL